MSVESNLDRQCLSDMEGAPSPAALVDLPHPPFDQSQRPLRLGAESYFIFGTVEAWAPFLH